MNFAPASLAPDKDDSPRLLLAKLAKLLYDARQGTAPLKIAGLVPSAEGAVIYVSKSTTATDTRTGLSAYDQAKPFATLAAAATAATSGNTVKVGPGVWAEPLPYKSGVKWELDTGAIVPIEGRAKTYIDAANVTDASARYRVAQFFAGLRTLGLEDDWVEGAAFRPGMNGRPGIAPVSLRGVDVAVLYGNPVWGPGGIQCDGVDDGMEFTIPDVGASAKTTMVWAAGDTASNASMLFLELINVNGGDSGFHLVFTLGSAGGTELMTFNASTIGTTAVDASVQPYSPEFHLFTGRDSNAGGAAAISLIVDNRTPVTGTGYVFAGTMTRAAIGSFRSTSGAPSAFYHTCTAAFLVFNRVLSDAEVENVRVLANETICQRTLLVAEGDSLTEGTNYLNYLPEKPNSWGLVTTSNVAAGGATSVGVVSDYASQVHALAPTITTPAWLLLMIGVNDLANLADSPATIFARISSVWASARADGFKVVAFTVMNALAITNAGRQADLVTLNNLIRNAGHLYDVLIDADYFFVRLIGSVTYYTNGTYFNGDQIHLITAGRVALAAEVDRALGFQVNPRPVLAGSLLTASATLNFGNTAAGAVTDLTISVPGAALGDAVALGVPHASIPAAGVYSAWVSAANVVTVRFANNSLVTAYDPASATFKVTVFKT